MTTLGTLLSKFGNPSLFGTSDSLSWDLDNGIFSVNSLYKSFFTDLLTDNLAATIWKIKAPLKVKITAWLAIHNHLLTSEVLNARRICLVFPCRLCGNQTESSGYLFLSWPAVSAIWAPFLGELGMRAPPNNLKTLRLSWKRRWVSARISKTWETTAPAIIWVIWGCRNEFLFSSLS